MCTIHKRRDGISFQFRTQNQDNQKKSRKTFKKIATVFSIILTFFFRMQSSSQTPKITN